MPEEFPEHLPEVASTKKGHYDVTKICAKRVRDVVFFEVITYKKNSTGHVDGTIPTTELKMALNGSPPSQAIIGLTIDRQKIRLPRAAIVGILGG